MHSSMHLWKQYLTEHEQEVRDIMVTLFDNETILKGYTKEKETAALNEGLARGRTEGMEAGQKLEKIENAKNLLKEGLPVELIARAINMPISEVSELKSKMAN